MEGAAKLQTMHQVRSREEEIVQLAVEEGHDADIPTNEGAIITHPSQAHLYEPDSPNLSSPTSLHDKDIEKEAGFGVSRSASVTSEQAQDAKEADNNAEKSDPNIVFWDGDDDPQNPMNWPGTQRWGAVAVVSAITFLTPLGSSIFAPGVELVMEHFNSTSELYSGFVVSVYVLGFAFGPLGKKGKSINWPIMVC